MEKNHYKLQKDLFRIDNSPAANTRSSFIAETLQNWGFRSRFSVGFGRYETARFSATKLTATR
jgi:hypothetical protein